MSVNVEFYADCIRKGVDPEAVLSVALAEQRGWDARIAERMFPLGAPVPGDAPSKIARAIMSQTRMLS